MTFFHFCLDRMHQLYNVTKYLEGAQWLSGRVLDSGPKGHGIEPHWQCGPCARRIYPSLVLVQPRKTRPYITERLLMGHKGSNQTNKQTKLNI